MFQEASLFAHLSVRRNLMFGAPRGEGEAQRGRIGFDEVVELLGITALLDRAPAKLSGGERQRVAIGRALLSQPKLLLMDEPLSALDRATKDEILPFLERLRDRLSLPIVYITHAIAEVERLADQIVLMDKGRVIGAGPLDELQSDPALPVGYRAQRRGHARWRRRKARQRLWPPHFERARRLAHRAGAEGCDRRTSPRSRHRRRRQPGARAAGLELHPQHPAGAHRIGDPRSERTRS